MKASWGAFATGAETELPFKNTVNGQRAIMNYMNYSRFYQALVREVFCASDFARLTDECQIASHSLALFLSVSRIFVEALLRMRNPPISPFMETGGHRTCDLVS